MTMNKLLGIEILSSQFLTVPGEPQERLHRDWMDRQARNYNRPYWPGGRTLRGRLYSLKVEPLTFTYIPQIPDSNLYRMRVDGREVFIGHPAAIQRLTDTLAKQVGEAMKRLDEMIWKEMYRPWT